MLMKAIGAVLACLLVCSPSPLAPTVTLLLSRDLTDFPGKEGLMIVVEYPSGGGDPIHWHNAHGFIYVPEGSAVMQLKRHEAVTLSSGQTFYGGGRVFMRSDATPATPSRQSS